MKNDTMLLIIGFLSGMFFITSQWETKYNILQQEYNILQQQHTLSGKASDNKAASSNFKAANNNIHGLALEAAQRHGIEPILLFAIIRQESFWNKDIVSTAGAVGLMQIMPATGKSFCGLSRNELFEPRKNLDCGTAYFMKQLKKFGDVKLALCAYNAGPSAVKKSGGCPNYGETRRYEKRILASISG